MMGWAMYVTTATITAILSRRMQMMMGAGMYVTRNPTVADADSRSVSSSVYKENSAFIAAGSALALLFLPPKQQRSNADVLARLGTDFLAL